ncbi:hypothetical protein HQ489_00130 [Candidatus Woesearchaeota archaeon]|nr:hypothetical protein [Candidatus Woesearchaeota archaeon]
MGKPLPIRGRYAEILAGIFLFLGFIISTSTVNPVFGVISIFIAGFIAGRVYFFKHKKSPILPSLIVIVAFIVGFLMGNIWSSRLVVFLFFVFGFGLSYWLYMKKILVSFKSENFLK